MQLLIIIGLLQAGMVPPPPAEPLQSVQVPAPPLIRQRMVPQLTMAERATPQRDTIDVEVRAAAELLWTGSMIVSNQQPSTYTRQLSEPSPSDCQPRSYGDQNQDSLSLEMSSRAFPEERDAFNITLRWGRSLPGTCPYRKSTRTVELSERITLKPNQTITLKGDAGITIRLHRR